MDEAATAKRVPEQKTVEQSTNSSLAHRTALLFSDATEAYQTSIAMQAIHVSLAYRENPYSSLSLVDLCHLLRSDEDKMRNLIKLAVIKHKERGVELPDGWEYDTPDIMESVFSLAQTLLVVDRETLITYYALYPQIVEDRRKPEEERLGIEKDTRRKLEEVAERRSRIAQE